MLTLQNLPRRNLKKHAGRTAALLLFSAIMAAAVFGGTMMIKGVSGGLTAVRARLGADIMITPESAKNEFDAQTVLLQAEPGYFYMDASVLEQVRGTEGVELASPQLFLASAKAGCCSVRVQMIAFDPATDFTITPWIKDSGAAKEMGLMDVVIGSGVSWASAADDNVIRFYDTDCRVVGQFDPTGSTLDSAVYMTYDTCRALIEACRDKGMFKYEGLDTGSVISSVMVRVKQGYDAEAVAADILARVEGVSAATAANMVSGIADNLERVRGIVSVWIAVFWAVGMLMTVLVFTLAMNERRREFASLRAMGACRRILNGIVAGEALLVSLTGGLIGIAVSAVLLFSFSGLIGSALGAGFVPPTAVSALPAAAAALLSVLAAAVPAALITVGGLNKMDASLVLKEGE